MKKRCFDCREYISVDNFGKDPRDKKYGRRAYCRPCEAIRRHNYYEKYREKEIKRIREYGKTEARRLSHKRMMARYPEKFKARTKLQLAVKKGVIEKGDCQTVMSDPCRGRIEAHHYLGYEGDHWKDVLWLCKRHHVYMHRVEKLAELKEKSV